MSGSASMRACHRMVAALVAVLTWTAALSSLAHQAAEPHRFCAEHGVLEEAEAGGTGALGFDEALGSPSTVAPGEPGDRHDDCPFAAALLIERVASSPLGDATRLPETPVGDPPPPAPHAAVALLALAPKTSPPHA